MRFLRQNQFLLCFMGVLVFSSVMVVRQILANQSRHVQMREDFLLLLEHGDRSSAEWLYQRLIQQLPALNETSLVQDLMRTSPLVTPDMAEKMDSLIWKYNVSVKKELERRSRLRIAHIVEHAEPK